jgi:plasmid stabilization system protein ParE
MAIQWSDFALESLEEIIIWYELEAGRQVADSVQNRIWQQVEKIDGLPMSIPTSDLFPRTRKLVISNLPYVAFIRQLDGVVWEVVDIVHTSRKLPQDQ